MKELQAMFDGPFEPEVTNDHVWLPASLVSSHSFLTAQFRCKALWDVVCRSPLSVLVSLESLNLNGVSGTYQVFHKGLPDDCVLHGIV